MNPGVIDTDHYNYFGKNIKRLRKCIKKIAKGGLECLDLCIKATHKCYYNHKITG